MLSILQFQAIRLCWGGIWSEYSVLHVHDLLESFNVFQIECCEFSLMSLIV